MTVLRNDLQMILIGLGFHSKCCSGERTFDSLWCITQRYRVYVGGVVQSAWRSIGVPFVIAAHRAVVRLAHFNQNVFCRFILRYLRWNEWDRQACRRAKFFDSQFATDSKME